MSLPGPLIDALRAPETLRIAVSGGVDSLCLSAAAARAREGRDLQLCHATSPAVPPAATARTRRFAETHGLPLRVIDAGEFRDERYRSNPVNRCYFCKSNLYGSLTALPGGATLAAGTNLDDLGDYRPGLRAADEHRVIHPFVTARMDKAAVRALARELGLGQIADLPAAPCLASRIQTGLRVEPSELAMIDGIETALRDDLGAVTLRCRRLPDALAIELDAALLDGLSPLRLMQLTTLARDRARPHGGAGLGITIRAYRQGSAFVHA